MKEFKIKDLTIYKYDFSNESKYRNELSKLLITNFGEGPYSEHDKVREVITYSYNYFCEKFLQICHNEKSVRFYQLLLSQHEQATEIAFFAKASHFPEGISKKYIALYRRILKWILEQACEVNLHNREKMDEPFLNRAKSILNELMYLGDMIFTCANIYAEQDMIEDVAEIIFDEDKNYVIKHKHHYDLVIDRINQTYNSESYKHVVDNEALKDLKVAVKNSFDIDYEMFTTVIKEIHKLNESKGGQYCGFGWESLPLSIESMFNKDPEKARIFYQGLTLSRNNKLSLQDLACKPQTMFRYIYRPILIWNIDGSDYAVITMNAFTESIIQLSTNCIPWGKAPEEWLNIHSFKRYVHLKEDEHDKWLDNDVEERLKKEGISFHRNLTSINGLAGHVTLNAKDIGEIDFIIIIHTLKKIYVADCKHLQGRYDMMTQKNDFANFTKAKGYNQQIQNKINFVTKHIEDINYHNKLKYGSSESDISEYTIEGIFIINTPTFYMFNSDFRIYSVDILVDKVLNRVLDPELTIVIDENDTTYVQTIKYPYFKKPEYKLEDLLKSDEMDDK